MFLAHSLSTIILAKKLVAKLRRFSGFSGFSCCTKMILYGYHFRMDFKTFHTLDQGRDKSLDTLEHLTQNIGNQTLFRQLQKTLLQFHLKSFSFFLFASHPNPQSIQIFQIFLSKPVIGPFRKQFSRRYSCNATDKLLPFCLIN